MLRMMIDNQTVEVTEGATILEAARGVGIDIPTLCFLEGFDPGTSCMLCLVKVNGRRGYVPSCATQVEEGMRVESDTSEIRDVRKTGLELLLSDHLGDCTAPCQNTCPVDMDIPLMLSQVQTGDYHSAITTIKRDIALPAILGRVCPELCERNCRRSDHDDPASICLVKRYVADVDLASATPHIPPCKPNTGKRVAIVGAGPTGLSAAFHLQLTGHSCSVFDKQAKPGGMLRSQFNEDQLSGSVIDGEVAIIEAMGANLQMGNEIAHKTFPTDLLNRFDAVLLASGRLTSDENEMFGLPVERGRLKMVSKTHETSVTSLFAAGDAVSPTELVVRNVSAGKSAARSIDQFLSGEVPTSLPRAFCVRSGRLTETELVQLTVSVSHEPRQLPSRSNGAGYTQQQAQAEAQRCLHCECQQHDHCKLRQYAQEYECRSNRFKTKRKSLVRHHQLGGVVYEPGKCILCGLCVQVATKSREPLGLTFIGRGFDMKVGIPFDQTMEDGLKSVAQECVDACPTGALSRGIQISKIT